MKTAASSSVLSFFLSLQLPLSANGYGTLECIDDTRCNAAAAWKAVGSPAYLDRELVHLLRRESELQQEKISYTRNSTVLLPLQQANVISRWPDSETLSLSLGTGDHV